MLHYIIGLFSRVSAHGHLKLTSQKKKGVGTYTDKLFVCITHTILYVSSKRGWALTRRWALTTVPVQVRSFLPEHFDSCLVWCNPVMCISVLLSMHSGLVQSSHVCICTVIHAQGSGHQTPVHGLWCNPVMCSYICTVIHAKWSGAI